MAVAATAAAADLVESLRLPGWLLSLQKQQPEKLQKILRMTPTAPVDP